MKKLAVFLASLPVALFAMGADCAGSASAATPCTTDADCTDAANPLCDAQTSVCVPGECTTGTANPCQVTDAGASASCQSDSDCTGADKCLAGSNDTKHCVTPVAAGDPPCTDLGATIAEVTVDGTTFCGDTAVSCEAPGKCAGGSF